MLRLLLIFLLALPLHAQTTAPESREIQAAANGGLEWLARQQLRDGAEAGSWDAPAYRSTVTSLAGLAFLANGHLPGQGRYGETVERALAYVMASQSANGYYGQGAESGMYAHAICTLFTLSYLGMSPDDERNLELAEQCRKAVAIIVEAQAVRRSDIARGGWRYTPQSRESDVSVTSWMLAVLQAARQCGYPVDARVIQEGIAYIDRAYIEMAQESGEELSGYLYRPGVSREPEAGATGVAIYIKSLIEGRVDERGLRALSFLERFPPSWGGAQYHGYFYFVSFYVSQGMFQVGGTVWQAYSNRLYRVLLDHQGGDGHWPFPPDSAVQARQLGAPYSTAFAVLILSLERQYLPMYQRQAQIFQ